LIPSIMFHAYWRLPPKNTWVQNPTILFSPPPSKRVSFLSSPPIQHVRAACYLPRNDFHCNILSSCSLLCCRGPYGANFDSDKCLQHLSHTCVQICSNLYLLLMKAALEIHSLLNWLIRPNWLLSNCNFTHCSSQSPFPHLSYLLQKTKFRLLPSNTLTPPPPQILIFVAQPLP